MDRRRGLEYLLGWSEVVDGVDVYHPFWAHDRDAEKAAYERFVDEVIARLDRDPYDARLPLRRVREDGAPPVDDPLTPPARTRSTGSSARGVLLDLYQVVRQGCRASVGLVLDQADRAVLPRPARGPDHRAGSAWSSTSAGSATATSSTCAISPTTTATTASRRAGCATGWRTAGTRPSASSAWLFERAAVGSGLPGEAQVADRARRPSSGWRR